MSPEERDHFEGIPRGISNRFGGSPDTESHYEVAPDDQSHYDVSPDASGDNYDVAPDDTSHYDVSPDARDRLEASPDAKPSLEVPSAAGSNFEISSTAGSRTSTLPALPTPAVLARYRIDTDRSDRSDRGSRDRDDSKDDVYEDWADYYFDAENFEAAKNRPRTKSAQTREAAQGYMARELSLDEYDGFWENPMSPGPGWI